MKFGLVICICIVLFVIGFMLGRFNAPYCPPAEPDPRVCPPAEPDPRVEKICADVMVKQALGAAWARSPDPNEVHQGRLMLNTLEGLIVICGKVEE